MQYRRLHQKGGTYFFTLVTHNRQPIFDNQTNINLLKNAIRYAKSRHLFSIDAIVILPDHIHCLWTLPDDNDNNAVRWMLIKSHVTRNLAPIYKQSIRSTSRKQKREQPIWQRRFWEHLIQSEDDYRKHIHYNPVKHGLVKSAEAWPYSSFHYYVKRGLYNIDWGESEDNSGGSE
ncbi:MAG: transposase [Gammaproteobacteria bacterium]|nr:transposase [Gammaproteobacteria bacterium]